MSGPHQGMPVETAGAPLDEADAAMVLLHGRGATPGSVLTLGRELDRPNVAFLAPRASNSTWYPNSFLSSIESNEPHLTSALQVVGDTVEEALDAGLPRERVALLGFSQGACLASEWVARNAARFGGLAALSGGVIGPPGTPREYEGSLDGTPVFVGCSDEDPHIPIERVHETTAVFEALDADVTEEIYPGMGHRIVPDELAHVRDILDDCLD